MENGDEIKNKKEQLNTNLVFGKKEGKNKNLLHSFEGSFVGENHTRKGDRELTFLPDVDDTVFRYSIVF